MFFGKLLRKIGLVKKEYILKSAGQVKGETEEVCQEKTNKEVANIAKRIEKKKARGKFEVSFAGPISPEAKKELKRQGYWIQEHETVIQYQAYPNRSFTVRWKS